MLHQTCNEFAIAETYTIIFYGQPVMLPSCYSIIRERDERGQMFGMKVVLLVILGFVSIRYWIPLCVYVIIRSRRVVFKYC